MEKLAAVRKNNKIRRTYSGLSHVVDFQALALIRGRLHPCLSVGKNVVEHACGYAHRALIIYIVYKLENARYALTRYCGYKQNGSIGHEAEVLFNG